MTCGKCSSSSSSSSGKCKQRSEKEYQIPRWALPSLISKRLDRASIVRKMKQNKFRGGHDSVTHIRKQHVGHSENLRERFSQYRQKKVCINF